MMMIEPVEKTMCNCALELLDSGFSIMPVRGKLPLIEWKKYQKEFPTSGEVERWFDHWPNADIGVITGELSNLVVVDADTQKAIEWINKNLPTSGVYAKTKNGLHYYCRYPEGEEVRNQVDYVKEISINNKGIDIRGEGGYAKMPPSVGYKWIFTTGLQGFDDLPTFTWKWFDREPTKKTGNISIDFSKVKSPVIFEPVAKGTRNDTLARLTGKWVGQNLHYEEIKILADGWNARNNPPLPEKEVETTIQSIINIDHKKNPIEIENADIYIPEKIDSCLPYAVLNPGGLLQDIMDYVERSSAVSDPIYNLAGAIALIGTLIGQKYMTETGLRTNMYCIALGHSGSGKDSPQSAIQKLVSKTNAHGILGPDELSSDAALIKYLAQNEKARSIVFMDEIGRLLIALKRPNSPAYSLPTLLMKLFSSANRGYKKGMVEDEPFVPWHHLSIYGASVPDRFWQSFSSGDSTDGFLNRILIHDSKSDPKKPKKIIDRKIPINLISEINELHEINNKLSGNIARIPIPKVIPFSKEADEIYDTFIEKTISIQTYWQKKNLAVSAIYARANEHCGKAALIHAASLYGKDLKEIGVDSIKWAIAYIDSIHGQMTQSVIDVIADNDFHRLMIATKKCIGEKASKANPGASKRQICRALSERVKVIDEVLQTLKESKEIVKETYNGQDLYCLIRRRRKK